jgi:hypothetical protein
VADFPLAYAFEALARPSALAGAKTDMRAYFEKVTAAGERIEEADDREHLFEGLATVRLASRR